MNFEAQSRILKHEFQANLIAGEICLEMIQLTKNK